MIILKKPGITRARLGIVMTAFIVAAAVMGLKIFSLKIIKGEEYEIKAKNQQVNRYDTVITANRGMIVDRNKQAMAVSTTVYNIVLDPLVLAENKTEEQERTINVLSEKLGLDSAELKRYVSVNPETGELYKNNHWTVLKKKVERTLAEELMKENLKGVVYDKDSERKYPLKTLGASVLGFIRGDTLWGLEQRYDTVMSGTPGRSFITYDDSGNLITQEIAAQDGNTIVTTIDFTIQQFAEQAAAQVMNDFGGNYAGVMVMDPGTGEIIAMAQSPGFDSNDPSTPLPAAAGDETFTGMWETYTDEEKYTYLNSVWKTFCISSTYEPGSIFKPVTVAAALEENIISTADTFYCSGSKTVADRTIGCWKRDGHGTLTLEGVLANSCNVAVMDIIEKMGVSTFYKYQKDFGFGSKTGIDLPAEIGAGSLMYKESEIGPVELATMGFGQSFACTSIQAMMAFSALINGGELLRPYVVSQVIDNDGNVVLENKKEVVRKVISQETSDIIRKYLQATLEYGTGTKAKIEGYSIGGKTGTAEEDNRDDDIYTISFFTYLPVDDPEYLVFVVMDRVTEYTEGVTSAAPAMKTLLENIIKYKGISPDTGVDGLPENAPSGDKVTMDDDVGRGLWEATPALAGKGLKYEVVGTGNLVTEQVPKAGTQVDEGSTILLYVERAEGDTGTVKVPDVVGKTYDEAVNALMDLGLSPVLTGDEKGVVTYQSPLPGITVDEGAEIQIRLLDESASE